jgi:hypothetical protein
MKDKKKTLKEQFSIHNFYNKNNNRQWANSNGSNPGGRGSRSLYNVSPKFTEYLKKMRKYNGKTT